jgi:hypothetical protein
VLASAKQFLESPNARPVLLLLDDVHLLKFGRTLGRNKNNLRKLFPLLSIVCTSNSTQPIPGLPHSPELFELKPPSVDQVEEGENVQPQFKISSRPFPSLRATPQVPLPRMEEQVASALA